MTLAVPVDNRPTAQMILHSLHHAFGRGCGALIGGAIINSYGPSYIHTCISFISGNMARTKKKK